MNFADTFYRLQIATTTASKHSSHNSLFPALPYSSFLHSHLLYPILITHILNFPCFSHYFCIMKVLHLPKLGQLHHHTTSWKNLMNSRLSCYFDGWSHLHIWNNCTVVQRITIEMGNTIFRSSPGQNSILYVLPFSTKVNFHSRGGEGGGCNVILHLLTVNLEFLHSILKYFEIYFY